MLIGYILPDSWDPPKIQESTGLLKNTTDIFGDELAYFKEVFLVHGWPHIISGWWFGTCFYISIYPLVIQHSYWKWPFIVYLPIETGDFQ